MRHIPLSSVFLLLLCVPVYGQAAAGSDEVGFEGDAAIGSSTGTVTAGTSGGNFTTGGGNFTTGLPGGNFTTEVSNFTTGQDQQDTVTVAPRSTTLDSHLQTHEPGIENEPEEFGVVSDQTFIDQAQTRLNDFDIRIQKIHQLQVQSIGRGDLINEELRQVIRRQNTLQAGIQGALEGNAERINPVQIEKEFREIDSQITRIEQRM